MLITTSWLFFAVHDAILLHKTHFLSRNIKGRRKWRTLSVLGRGRVYRLAALFTVKYKSKRGF